MSLRIGDILTQMGVLTLDQRDKVLRQQERCGRPFGVLAEEMFGVREQDVEIAWARQFAAMAEHIDPESQSIDPSLTDVIGRRQAWQFGILPLRRERGSVVCCTSQENLVRAIRFAAWRIDQPCEFVLTDPDRLAAGLKRHFPIDGLDSGHLRAAA